MEKETETSTLRRASDLPVSAKSSVSGGLVHHIESTTASVKLTGYKVRRLSETESEFTSSSSEEKDYTITEIDLNKEVISLSGFEDTEPLTDTKNEEYSVRNSSYKEKTTFPSQTPDTVIKEIVKESQQKSELKKLFSEVRFNPFDRDLHMEEEHFKDDVILTMASEHDKNKCSSNSSSWADVSDDNPEITNADLGLAEDHFSHPEGHFGLSSTEEMEMAIENCKELIGRAQPHSDRHKNLVQKLVQLRLKLQELKDGPEPVPQDVKLVVGHKFQTQESRSTKYYCEKCNAMILGVIQKWFRCAECGYSCHEKCLNNITRMCASQKVLESPEFFLSICPNRGLSAQNYRCAECRKAISFQSGFSEPRLCDYSGQYYCELCHWNNTMVIPARVLHNWDFEPRKVSRASKQFLKLMKSKAVIRIQDVNPMLFNFVEELNDVKKLREELLIMKKYLLVCSEAMSQKFLLLLRGRQHFVETSDKYSMQDLLDITSDTLLPELANIHTTWAQHIKTDCQKCQAKGFICELCDDKETLFPFDSIAVVCSQCSYVLHRHCFANRGAQCPRCERRSKRNVK
ncbi:differentially expressed in FDCP 8 homolog A-like [Crassostrea virginica]|uniref:Differentially expressed in FDCP 8 homolog A-like n=1 Tax=Crassostrea virginica TaxID=6565 RepID=A0A8B8DVD2_CRAVI|nr:differentially expressed in FDCP 8 homolog A-like [Crassostrea virginica]XP_022331684.1 differentially expressed in FDCP 8 homolog A-like [Crassostrea virginica]